MAADLRLAIISEGTNTWPLYVAEAKGFYAREGVRVVTTLTGSSVKQLAALAGGGFDVGFQQSDHIVRAVEQGIDLFAFMAHGHAPELSLVVAPEIGGLHDLKGKVLAVDGARTGYALLLRKVLARNGLAADDCRLAEFGGSQERCDALAGGQAVASYLNPPFDRQLLARGFKSLGSTGEHFPDYPGPVAAARRAWAAANESTLRAFIRAFDAASAWLQDPANKAEAVALLPARLKIDAAAAAAAFDKFAGRGLPEITADGLRQVIDVVWEAEGFTAPQPPPEKYLDLGYLERARRRLLLDPVLNAR